MKDIFRSAGKDIPASIVVTLVALPLCLGIAMASGASPLTGIIAGIVGGIVTGIISGSQLSVSGPAAGLTTIVAAAIGKINAYDAFILSVVLAGIFQVLLASLKAGIVGNYIPPAVIKGMMAAIGIILIMKQLPHLIGYDADFIGDESFLQFNNENTFTAIAHSFESITPLAATIGLTSLFFLRLWETPFIKKNKWLEPIPGPLIAVMMGILSHLSFTAIFQWENLDSKHLVSLPLASTPSDYYSMLTFPDFSSITNPQIWLAAFTIAIVASLETLLGIEAVDKIDPQKRTTPPNRELFAQGIGNISSGLLGGLPITSVVVRSSANVNAGAQTRLSSLLHGLLLLLSVIFIPHLLNKIPLSALAAILIFTGYKLVSISLFKEMYRLGWHQFIPFIATILSILLSDLLVGIMIGLMFGFYYVVKSNSGTPVLQEMQENKFQLLLRKDISWLSKATIKNHLKKIPPASGLIIDLQNADYIDHDIIEAINQFIKRAAESGIQVEVRKKNDHPLHQLIAEPENGMPNK